MKKIQGLFLLFLCLITGPVFAEQDIEGKYKCSGYDPVVRSGYDTGMVITKNRDVYNFKWEELEENFDGTGFFMKQSPDILVAEFWNPKKRERSGAIVYTLKPDGSFEGEWSRSDKNLVGTENCKKL